jgi:2-amino-4-hydroxy-6-hydroxymethyldihydropteridine diphosphokinase
MYQVFLSLGSNVGDRLFYLKKGIGLLSQMAGTVRITSSVYETEPWGCSLENNFYNMTAVLETPLKPENLLAQLKKIEVLCGRKPENVRYSDRTLDIDILIYGSKIVSAGNLKIPHPLLHERRFVLLPLAEIAPDTVHPVFNKSISQLLADCMDESRVIRIIQQ